MSIAEPPVAEAGPSPFSSPDDHHPHRGLRRLLMFFGVLVLLAGAGALWVRSVAAGEGGPSRPVTVLVPQGASAGRIAELLEQSGVIRQAWLFKVLARLDGRAAVLKPGEYGLRTGMSYAAVLAALEAGPIEVFERVVIPEGKTIREIVDIIRRRTSLSASRFEEEIRSGRHRLPIVPAGSSNLEGLLFPKTYDIKEGTGEAQALQMMLDQFTKETAGLDFGNPRNLTPYQVIVLASLVEREAKIDQDRGKIAGVIYNRLRRGMRLQIDATVQYAIQQKTGAYKPRLTFEDYEIDSVYNTYRIDGLPPAPIASPGLDSILAAIRPASTDAIFYVLCDRRGGHAFARTADEFDRLKVRCKEARA
ncbi:MAG: endolytic transglycosylase MltG [Actinomycetota bacterium]